MKSLRTLLPLNMAILACFAFLGAEVASGQVLSSLLGKAKSAPAPSSQPDPP